MSRMVGTVSRGVRAPIIRSGDDLVEIVTKSVLEAAAQPEDGFAIRDRDVVAMTEAIVARAQGNYASVADIAADVKEKLGGETVGVIFPILSRNRFAVCLRGIAKGAKKIVLMLSYPSDEVGNHLIDPDVMDEKGVDPYRDVLTIRLIKNSIPPPHGGTHDFSFKHRAFCPSLFILTDRLTFVKLKNALSDINSAYIFTYRICWFYDSLSKNTVRPSIRSPSTVNIP